MKINYLYRHKKKCPPPPICHTQGNPIQPGILCLQWTRQKADIDLSEALCGFVRNCMWICQKLHISEAA